MIWQNKDNFTVQKKLCTLSSALQVTDSAQVSLEETEATKASLLCEPCLTAAVIHEHLYSVLLNLRASWHMAPRNGHKYQSGYCSGDNCRLDDIHILIRRLNEDHLSNLDI